MPQLSIIGAGQLGSRHLQALARLRGDFTVHVVEPSADCQLRAEQRYAEVATPESPRVTWATTLAGLPAALDVAIVATAADTRRAVVEALVAQSSVRHLVLEKVLFQSAADYAPIAQRLAERGVSAWVNCPRRMWSFYSTLRARLGDGPLQLRVAGSAWGLASNAVHFLDLFALLSAHDDITIDALRADPQPSRRPGFVELAGDLTGHGPTGGFSLTSFAGGDAPLVVELATPSLRAVVRESEGKAWVATHADKWSWTEERVEAIPQSALSHLVVRALLDEGACALPTLASSTRQHLPFLNALSKRLGEERCPIT